MPNLPVGDELNAIVAQHVFGWKLYRGQEAQNIWPHLDTPLEEQKVWYDGKDAKCALCGDGPPDYLTGDGMLRLVEKMHELEWSWSVTNGSGDDVFYAEFTKHIEGREHRHIQEWHEDAPTATGQAALKALGVIR